MLSDPFLLLTGAQPIRSGERGPGLGAAGGVPRAGLNSLRRGRKRGRGVRPRGGESGAAGRGGAPRRARRAGGRAGGWGQVGGDPRGTGLPSLQPGRQAVGVGRLPRREGTRGAPRSAGRLDPLENKQGFQSTSVLTFSVRFHHLAAPVSNLATRPRRKRNAFLFFQDRRFFGPT